MTTPTVGRVEVVGYSKDKRPPWNTLTRSVLNATTVATARKRHDADGPYGVVLRDAEGLVAIALGTERGRYARVEFLDPSETFAPLSHHLVDDGRGGLRLVTVWRSNAESPSASETFVKDTITWAPDPTSGRWFRVEQGASRLVEARGGFDLDTLAVPWPEFGDYAALVDRGLLAKAWPGIPDLPLVGT